MGIRLSRADLWTLAIAALCAAAALALTWFDPGAALTGWLGAATAFAGLPAGSLCLLAMMKLIPGAWGEALRLTCEAGTMLALPAFITFLPVMAGTAFIYPWMSHRPDTAFQIFWLGPFAFALRTVLWFALLWGAARSIRARRRSRAIAVAALIALPVLGSLVAVDWLMSLDLKFASSAFGLQMLILSLCLAYCALLMFRIAIGSRPYRIGVLGALLLTLLLIWAYIQFLTFFISWSPGLPEGAEWYGRRAGGWDLAEWAFALLGAIPLIMLLFAAIRADAVWLLRLSVLVIAGKLIEFAWFALPGRGVIAVVSFLLASLAFSLLASAALGLALRRRIARRAPK
ncbi:hypothetical protein EDF56_11319 [Novosphingobium sp. PhB165]|uniref:hypothetical protein n=1 Tax=Novosphingobium sp. PhB165 TaxID=2485105 RepID=UPI00104307D6|nr:hypothetical protein [Novosphingobium sp. PhB165]TCM14374.1 hypothetical protein EDF56_11319 [Novosphingobium sp. PhB165]